jgi:hypothetical protein
MKSNRMLSLNEIDSAFSVEELEPRLEMQMLGIGTDPGIIETRDWIIIIVISSTSAITII